MSVFWSSFGLGSKDSVSKSEKARAAIENDLKYLYSAFTKIPCLRLAPDHRARLIRGYEEFPFDTAVPLHAFKNLGSLEIIDVDFRSFFGWDRLAEQLRTLTLKRANVDDIGDLLTGIVLDDIDKRRKRSTKNPQSPGGAHASSPYPHPEPIRASSAPGSPVSTHSFGKRSSPKDGMAVMRAGSVEGSKEPRAGSVSPPRPVSSRRRHTRTSSKLKRSGSGSSNSSEGSTLYRNRNRSMSNLLVSGSLPSTKWRFLRHLGLPDNSMTNITATSLAPVANSLHSLDLSWNLFTQVPDSLSTLIALRSLNLSHCMIDSLHSLSRNPLPAITALNLRANRLRSIVGVERLLSLERLDLRENSIPDPTEMARLTSIPYLREIWVEGNPFTKSHPDYRVTIFNLFRRTPGYSEDILIDGTGPSYSERKKLAERVAEPESAPVIRQSEQVTVEGHSDSVALPVGPSSTPVAVLKELPVKPVSVRKHEHVGGSTRRRKAHRRRIVDLSQEESLETISSEIVEPTTPKMDSPLQGRQETPSRPPLPRLNTNPDTDAPVSSNANATATGSAGHFLPVIEGVDWDTSGDLYRQRLEALKQEVGTNWLTVLDDETWGNKRKDMGFDGSSGPDLHPVGPIHPTHPQRANNQGVTTGGRTLG